MKKMYTMIAVMMMSMAIAMPATASNHSHHGHHDMKGDMVMLNGHNYRGRPDTKTCTIKVGRHDSHHMIEAKAERMRGVLNTHWNPRTHEVIIRYDARFTSSYDIKRHLK